MIGHQELATTEESIILFSLRNLLVISLPDTVKSFQIISASPMKQQKPHAQKWHVK